MKKQDTYTAIGGRCREAVEKDGFRDSHLYIDKIKGALGYVGLTPQGNRSRGRIRGQ